MTQITDAFKTALQFTLKWEGGAGHPNDLAGTVYRGISQASYDTYRQRKGLSQQSVNKITDSEVENLYFEDYWLAAKTDTLCLPLAIVHFDTAVNFSVRSSLKFLQEAVGGLVADGNYGPRTAAAVAKQNNPETAKRYCQNRINYRYERVKQNPSQEQFLKGWLRRDNDLMSYINQLASNTGTPSATGTPTGENKAEPLNTEPATNDKIAAKLDQAISLLQEVAVLLKQNK